jgi:hypothetical protein
VFCAVLAFSRVRFVRFAPDQKATTTLGLLAECFETLGGEGVGPHRTILPLRPGLPEKATHDLQAQRHDDVVRGAGGRHQQGHRRLI